MEDRIFPAWVQIITIHWSDEDELWQVAIMSAESEAPGQRVDGFGKSQQEAWYAAWDKVK